MGDAMDIDQLDNISPVIRNRPYQLVNQKVELDINFNKSIEGKTTLTLCPEIPQIPGILFNARQCRIKSITVNGLKASAPLYEDPCDRLCLHTATSVKQHHVLTEKLANSLSVPPEEELFILLPEGLVIEENPFIITQADEGAKSVNVNNINEAEATENLTGAAVSRYTPLEVVIEFSSLHTRDALQFAIGPAGSGRWPHVYTRGGFLPGRTSALFPCLDTLYQRCPWEISITGPRTVGDALRQAHGNDNHMEETEEARVYEAKEMVFISPGDVTDDFISKTDPTKRTVSYTIAQNTSAQHIGFAIGPFERVDLAKLREADKIELLQENAAPIAAYCLPGRSTEAENTCLPTTEALDYFAITHAPYPFSSFSYLFVDDHSDRPDSFAGLTICTSRMLYPENVIDPAQEVTRTLVQCLTTQWLGIQIAPKQLEDTWVVLGSALFLADLFMKDLCGNNEYRFRMKQMSDRVCELDHQRPSIWDMGALLHIDESIYEFLALKSPLVLYILDRRIVKMTGSPKMSINIGKFMSRARNEDLKDNLLSTQDFCRLTERVLHNPVEDFMNQWVRGAGCPRFVATQRFNKKKLVIEMSIKQTQSKDQVEAELDPETFMRDVREEYGNVYAAPQQNIFTGPMTIRIHEADGTPYEHIIQIKEETTTFDVPYNTKYKRLKRGKKNKNKNAGRGENAEDELEPQSVIFGDVLQDEDEIAAWRISEWSEEDETRMNAESYEWIRLDADFEWIAKLTVQMPGHMFQSQLQQDRDVTAQLVSIQHLNLYKPGKLISSILLRTMMDDRYFHGIRSAAASSLVRHASTANNVDNIGFFQLTKAFTELYCMNDGNSIMTRPNDFSNQLSYFLQCSIVEAISNVRGDDNYTPLEVKQFLLDKLRFNDNTVNEYSDAHYVSLLIRALTRALIARPKKPAEADLDEDLDMAQTWAEFESFERQCLAEIDRYRRMDEWTSSYQNLYSRTALECQSMLARAGIGQPTAAHFFQYIRPGNYDMLIATAYEVLALNFMFTYDAVLMKVIHGMIANNSPYIRRRVLAAVGRALGRKAIGIGKADTINTANGTVETVHAQGNLVQDAARLTNIEAALEALKRELASHKMLEKALSRMLTHPEAGYEDISALNDFCRMAYHSEEKAKVCLNLPRYWRIEKTGKGKFAFYRTPKVRTKRIEPWKPRPQALSRPMLEPQRRGSTMLKLKLGGASQSRQNSLSMSQPTQSSPTPPAPEPAKPMIKLKFGSRPS